jgi:hypothetical protein
MLPHRPLLMIALSGFLLESFVVSGAQAQSRTAPTASADPETRQVRQHQSFGFDRMRLNQFQIAISAEQFRQSTKFPAAGV